ncbi:hypothetical protein B2J88_35880 [Rhodococcus sp. SRB_17]|nr:hypothetical protein [Rhodococcus sp. SRB_17]
MSENEDIGQGWFSTPEWQENMRESLSEIEAGHLIHFGSGDEFIEHLERIADQEKGSDDTTE